MHTGSCIDRAVVFFFCGTVQVTNLSEGKKRWIVTFDGMKPG
jgi:hypothetical protein